MPAISLAAPPRDIPFSLRLRVQFGGVVVAVGWLILAVGAALCWAIVGESELLTAGAFDAPLGSAEGRVIDRQETSYEVNGARVTAVEFEYRLGDTVCRGTSWTRQRQPDVGDAVAVEYVRSRPTIARIRGMSTAALPRAVGFVLLAPLAGIVLVLVGAFRGGRRVRLLRDGVLAHGRLIDRHATGTEVNGRTVYRLRFAFTDGANVERTGIVRSHRLDLLDDGEPQPLLYEPHGDRIVAWNALPGRPAIDRDGLLQPVGLVSLLPVLLPPTALAVAASLVSQTL